MTVVDADPSAAASDVAAGMLAPVTEARLGEEPSPLNRAPWARWPGFAAEAAEAAGRPLVGYRADGTLVVALDADDWAVLDELAARHRPWG